MSVRKEVELIIKQNITKRTLNHLDWDPCATSTPVRKPLNILDNFEPGFGYNQCNVISRNISFKTTPKRLGEGQNSEGNSRKNTKKNKTKSRGNSFYRGRDDDNDEESDDNEHHEDRPKDNGTKKNLIIKLGSDQFDNKRIKKTSTGEEKKELSQDSVTNEQIEVTKKAVACRSNNNKTKAKAYNSNKIVPLQCVKRKTPKSENSSDKEVIEITTNTAANDSPPSNLVKNEKDLTLNKPNTEDTGVENTSCKRKNNIAVLNQVVSKKSKSDQELEVYGLKNEDGDPIDMKIIDNSLDKSMKERKTKMSTSHEIFSESKERELRDSLDMTAAPVTEKFNDNIESNQSEIIQVLKRKQKVTSKKKSCDSRNKLKLKAKSLLPIKMNAAVERPKRARKSPKEFWLPKSEDSKLCKDSVHEVNNTNKVEETELSSQLETQLGQTGNKKTMTSNKDGSSNSLLKKDFYNIKEMEFTEIPSNGNEREVYSYALGWKFPAFKCGALKIGQKCESSGRTEHENSHFGGVLLEGKLLMKIQENEVELSSGQMFCVPPLTDWKATNITRKDCIVYYWCGRF